MTESTEITDIIYDVDPEKWLYPIYVPSYSRANTAPLLNLLALAPEYVQERVHVVVRRSETMAYRKAYPWAKIVPQQAVKGIGPARMDALWHAEQQGYKRIVMMDDDITKVGVLEDRTERMPSGRQMTPPRSGRYSAKNTPWEGWEFTLHCLALGCKMADAVFELASDVAYGSTRSAFMSNSEDVQVTATIDRGGFPLCVMFIDLERFDMREMPKPFRLEGEDLAMYLHAYEQGWSTFTFNTLIFDDDRGIASTIPFSGDGEVDRVGNLIAAQGYYPKLGPYLRASNINKNTGAVKRITMDWRRWHKEHGTNPTYIMTGDVLSFIEEEA